MELMYDMIRYVQSFSSPFLDWFFQLVTIIGEDTFFIMMVTLVYWCLDKEFGYKLGFAYMTSGLFNTALKEIFRVPRPIGQPGIRSLRIETAGGYSFPSGHSQMSSTIWLSLMIRIRRRWIYFLGIAMMLLIGLSRVYLGVHTPMDVVGGIAAALVWIFISNWIFDMAHKTRQPALLLVFVVPALACMSLFQTATYYKAAGTTLGLWLGYLTETRYINFQVKSSLWGHAVKMVLGLAGLLAIKTFVKLLLPEVPLSDFARYLMLGLWMTVAAPLLFERVLKLGVQK